MAPRSSAVSYDLQHEIPPEGCQHYADLGSVPWDIQRFHWSRSMARWKVADLDRYYHQRHSIFSKYDEGIWMTEDAWFGVTPEPAATCVNSTMIKSLVDCGSRSIAKHISEAAPAEKAILIDCFAGVGGNVIAFALSGRWRRVYAIEKDPKALACAKHNAKIYGVQDKISWYAGDCFEIVGKDLAKLGSHSVIFASPPWGGECSCHAPWTSS